MEIPCSELVVRLVAHLGNRGEEGVFNEAVSVKEGGRERLRPVRPVVYSYVLVPMHGLVHVMHMHILELKSS